MSNFDNMTPSEKEVSKLLDALGIWWKYEFPLFVYDDNNRPRIWTPDFFLPVLGIFIEVCGSGNVDYSYREKVYDKNVTRIIFVHYYKEPEKWKSFLVQRLFDLQIKRLKQTDYAIQKARDLGINFQLNP